ncbi:MAG: hypothetical protein IJB01_04315 [Bacteroidaceae bacterium]|nr:hypothetical protein [Bacteroidaceae bacterium]
MTLAPPGVDHWFATLQDDKVRENNRKNVILSETKNLITKNIDPSLRSRMTKSARTTAKMSF